VIYRPTRRSFVKCLWGQPTWGSTLTVLNCLLWLLIALFPPAWPLALILSIPLACWFLPPVYGGISSVSALHFVMICVVVGVNSFLWGRGLALLLRLGTMARRRGPASMRIDGRRDGMESGDEPQGRSPPDS
jgi:hypothetical protein